MLVLARRIDECIHLGHDIRIRIVDITRGIVRLGIEAPPDTEIWRAEIYRQQYGYDEWQPGGPKE